MIDGLPPGWMTTSLGDVAHFERGVAFPSSDKSLEPRAGHVACLRTKNVQGEVDWEDLWFVPRAHARTPAKLVQLDDILISTANSYDLVGKVARVRTLPTDATFGAFIGVLRAVGIDPAFLHHRVGAPDFQSALRGTASQTTNIANISSSRMLELEIDVPPLNEQRRIVDKLDAIFERTRAARARLESIPAMLDQLRQSILAAAFRGDLTKDWREAHPDVEPASVLLERIRAERRRRWEEGLRAKGKDPKKATYEEPAQPDLDGVPDLPTTWAYDRAEALVEPGTVITYGIVLPGAHVPDGVPYIRGLDIRDGQILVDQLLRTTPEIAAKHSRSVLAEGDVLLCVIRYRRVAIVPKGLDGANLTQGTVRMRPSSILLGPYLALWLDSPAAQAWMQARTFGNDMPRINVEDARAVPIPLAPLEEQVEVCRRVRALLARVEAAKSTLLEQTRAVGDAEAAALAKAFRGELVPQDPNDEPASALLERIRAQRSAEAPAKRSRGRPRASPAAKQNGSSHTNGNDALSSGGEPLDLVVAALVTRGRASSADVQGATGLDAAAVRPVLKSLERLGKVAVEGKARGTAYRWLG